jgi:hypothetical protein
MGLGLWYQHVHAYQIFAIFSMGSKHHKEIAESAGDADKKLSQWTKAE